MSIVHFVEEDQLDNKAVRVIAAYPGIRVPQQGETVFMPASKGFVWRYQAVSISQFPAGDHVIVHLEKTQSTPIPALNFGGDPPTSEGTPSESGGIVPESLPPGGGR